MPTGMPTLCSMYVVWCIRVMTAVPSRWKLTAPTLWCLLDSSACFVLACLLKLSPERISCFVLSCFRACVLACLLTFFVFRFVFLFPFVWYDTNDVQVLSDYTSDELDLSDDKVYRDLKKPSELADGRICMFFKFPCFQSSARGGGGVECFDFFIKVTPPPPPHPPFPGPPAPLAWNYW